MVNPRYMAVISREREAREGPRPPRRGGIRWRMVAIAAGGAAILYYVLSSDGPSGTASAPMPTPTAAPATEGGKAS